MTQSSHGTKIAPSLTKTKLPENQKPKFRNCSRNLESRSGSAMGGVFSKDLKGAAQPPPPPEVIIGTSCFPEISHFPLEACRNLNKVENPHNGLSAVNKGTAERVLIANYGRGKVQASSFFTVCILWYFSHLN